MLIPPSVRLALLLLSIALVAVGGYHRIQSFRSGERLDRSKEGWPIFICIRLVGLLSIASTMLWLWRPQLFEWASWPIPTGLRWLGVSAFACTVAWLSWMFHALGRNLTDSVVTRKAAYFVDHGPYRYVRNPMYIGVLIAAASYGLALGTWLLILAGSIVFALLVLRTPTEEAYLVARFGDQYRAYMRRVGRFFPKLHG